MYERELRLIQGAVKDGRIIFRFHALKELRAENFSTSDAIHCILVGEIVEDRIGELKYVIYGESISQREMGVVTKWDDDLRVVVITAFQLEFSDYE